MNYIEETKIAGVSFSRIGLPGMPGTVKMATARIGRVAVKVSNQFRLGIALRRGGGISLGWIEIFEWLP